MQQRHFHLYYSRWLSLSNNITVTVSDTYGAGNFVVDSKFHFAIEFNDFIVPILSSIMKRKVIRETGVLRIRNQQNV